MTTPDFITPEKAKEWLLNISTGPTGENKLDKKKFGNAYRPGSSKKSIKIKKTYINKDKIYGINKEIKKEFIKGTTDYLCYYEEKEELKSEEGLELGQATINLIMANKKLLEEIADLKKRIEFLEAK